MPTPQSIKSPAKMQPRRPGPPSYRFTGMDSANPLGDCVTTIQISNLHCGSCVHTIEEALSALIPAPLSVEVSIVLQSVTVHHHSSLPSSSIQAAILDAGFDIARGPFAPEERRHRHLEQCNLCKEQSNSHSANVSQQGRSYVYSAHTQVLPGASIVPEMGHPFRLTLSVEGMTCSSCSNTVTRALSSMSGVTDASVSLLEGSATAILEREELSQAVLDAVYDCGFEARIISLKPIESVGGRHSETTRTVSLLVGGMFCRHCPEKVMSAIHLLQPQISVEKPLTSYTDPILVLKYTPDPPSLSIRTIISTIASVNSPPFSVTVYQPPSVEQLSRDMRIREKHHFLFRLLFTFIVAIPTFIIGVVYMSLVQDGNPTKMYLMEPMWAGNVARSQWALLFLATPVMFYSANIFHRRSIKEIRALWRTGSHTTMRTRFLRFGSMNLLVSSGVSVAYFSSVALLGLAARQSATERGDTSTYFDSVVLLTMFLLAGRMLEVIAKTRTADAITALGLLRPTEALLVVPKTLGGGLPVKRESTCDLEKGDPDSETSTLSCPPNPGTQIQKIQVDLLEIGDVVRVPSGSSPPADGTVMPGEQGSFDESSLTGESRLVKKEPGDKVFLGTISAQMVQIMINAIEGRTLLDDIVNVVREGQARRAPIERIADKITGHFVPVVTFLAISTWIIWLALGLSGALPPHYLDIEVGGWTVWSLEFAISVFVVACPCGIGLAAPTALLVGSGLAAKFGILARGGGEAFQEMERVDVVVFDKTGTLTLGQTQVSDYQFFDGGRWKKDVVLGIASELESSSSHPLAIAIQQFCATQGALSQTGSSFAETAGRGVKATFQAQNSTAIIGNESWMKEHGVLNYSDAAEQIHTWKAEAKSVVLLAIRADADPEKESSQFEVAAVFAITDPARVEAVSVVSTLQQDGISVWMISGDNFITASAVAAMVGIPHSNVIAGVLPHEKADKIEWLQHHGQKRQTNSWLRTRQKTSRTCVLMVGDGINDSPALTVADVGVAVGSGSDIAIFSASFILLSSDLRGLITLSDLSRCIMKRVRFNFLWAIMFNALAVPIAAGVIYPAGHARLNPVWASLAMALSSLSVVCSSLALKLYKPPTKGAKIGRPRT